MNPASHTALLHAVNVPAVGDGEHALVAWYAQPGDRVDDGQKLGRVRTPHGELELVSPTRGVWQGLMAEVGRPVEPGALLGHIGPLPTTGGTPAATDAVILPGRAGALAHYPHARRVGNLLFVSGVSSRRHDNSHEGVSVDAQGGIVRDIRVQTRAVLENIRVILRGAGADLCHVVDMTTFLTDMAHFKGYNAVYNSYFDAETGPTRTTVAVHQLPHPNLLIEMKAIAALPS